jgi:CHAT domain-containing protein
VSALVESYDLRIPRFVIERHVVVRVPNASAVSIPVRLRSTHRLVGIADPIYNAIDERMKHPNAATAQTTPEIREQLPRLTASGLEIESCADIWRERQHEAVVFKGRNATKKNLLDALSSPTAVLHVAAHTLSPRTGAGPSAIALSLNKGRLDLLSATEIGRMRLNVGLVVLNSCSSGSGQILPSSGLMGMTRSWLAAGAHAVIATHWEISDSNAGEIFDRFYRQLTLEQITSRPYSVAEALQSAQRAVLQSGGPNSRPSYWAAYFSVTRLARR